MLEYAVYVGKFAFVPTFYAACDFHMLAIYIQTFFQVYLLVCLRYRS